LSLTTPSGVGLLLSPLMGKWHLREKRPSKVSWFLSGGDRIHSQAI
jgi:hypothetical protein